MDRDSVIYDPFLLANIVILRAKGAAISVTFIIKTLISEILRYGEL